MPSLIKQSLERLCLACGIFLMLIWPLSGTIAARNTALAIGCLASLAWIYSVRPKITLSMTLPALCLLAVPGWLWMHYFFLPTDTAAQLYDLRGTWLRAILAVLMASGLGLMIARRPKRMIWIWLAMAALALTTLGRFLLEVWRTHQWVINDFRFPFKYKSALVYFLMYPCLVAYGLLHYCVVKWSVNSQSCFLGLSLNLVLGLSAIGLVTVCWVDFIAAHALNGVLVAGMVGLILLLTCLIYSVRVCRTRKSINYWLLLSAVLVVLSTALTLFWQYDQKYERKLTNIVSDMQVAAQIDVHPHWQRDPVSQDLFTPTDSLGRAVNVSTYERTAWFVKGISLLQEYPLGAGFSYLAFRYWMHQENPNLHLSKTHSGWLDYALGLGLPGLLLTWLAMGLVILRYGRLVHQGIIENQNAFCNALVAIWILGGVWALWWPVEVSEREFIEYLFFMVSLLGAAIPLGNSELAKTS